PDGRGKSKVFPNDAEGFAALLAWGRAQGVDWMQTGVCLEATGPYDKPLARAQQVQDEALRSLANVLKALEDEIARLRDAIRDHIDHDPDQRHKAAKRHNPVLRAFCERLAARGKRPKQVMVAAMRKLVHLNWAFSNPGVPSTQPSACHDRRKTVSE
ncbi:MAG: hypothetical protein H5U26_14015, partial [Immundisolibacter sp.]|nr:hypothetical protein [Immundisolibacter sp.]